MFRNFVLNSDLAYPPILRSGTVAFTKTNDPLNVVITSIASDETHLIAIQEGGYIRRPSYYEMQYNGTNIVYRDGTTLRLFMNDFAARSGTIYWRIYADG